MKISENYMITEISGNMVAFPVGQGVADMSKMIELNETAAFICDCLKNDLSVEELQNLLYKKYECEEHEKAIVRRDLDQFLSVATAVRLITY